ncbi:hypothetical protein ASPZODRAFT_71839 [Penicilliopsis zonata CBS 506.65]|uniref:GDT1 family protein n=1 Tax=Penicilliopsis zonata CBS 506.65 TaxID=1073090 RepID=A0A1L9SAK7_9EURO|nr:hypothetical protein ASPZODRAFT_71839 [Penicilliopsis zonata CBS 506.65]OJJ44213.1 hypothetical protein ASPZODRAFT_71839 [Penicilliopsis zonata CBS 506.65]
MRIHHLSTVLFLVPTLALTVVSPTPVQHKSTDTKPTILPSGPSGLASPKALPRGTLDAPVDDKDGKPHAGPWVETNADRDRKKVMEASPDGHDKFESTVTSLDHLGSDGKPIPHSNDGVMDDPYRLGPKEGTRGTEGGVSGKLKDGIASTEKTPDGPKEAPPLPHSEQQKIPTTEDGIAAAKELKAADGLLEKPNDLPEKPHDIAPPKAPGSVNSDPLGMKDSASSKSAELPGEADGTVGSSFHSLVFSFTMIIVSEIGDKTFLVAALMAMRHPRLVVFSSAFCALITMTVLSAVLGHAVPTLIPKQFTKFLAAVLFLVFGVRMVKEGREMSPDEGVGEEMKEVEMELEEKEQQQMRMNRRRSSVTPHNLEAGRAGRRKSRSSTNRLPSPPESLSSSSSSSSSPSRGSSPTARGRLNDALIGMNNLFSLLLSPAWVQTFVMTFLGEWGDRSQIATIAMAAGQDYWWVTIGAISGHGICTAAAVIGGRAIAGRVSMRVVTLGGATAFLIFGIIYLIEAIF